MGNNSKAKKRGKKKRSKSIGNKLLLIIILAFIVIVAISISDTKVDDNATLADIDIRSEIFEDIGSTSAEITKYIVYGTHFNLEGSLSVSDTAIDKVKLVIKSSNNADITVNTEYTIENSVVQFTTGETINEGIDLESFDVDSYYFLLKVTYTNGQEKYYSLCNETEYGNIDYYTITKNNENNKIYINFDKYNSISYLNFEVTKVDELPDDVYDIVIDPGHGGVDVGATNGNYYESEIVLECAKLLKTKLEDLGLKVFLTRDGTEDENINTAYNMYDDDGRITLAMESNAKIFISLHLNSNEEYLTTGGVEVYVPSNIETSFAQLLADNIVEIAGTNYSYLETYKVSNGVYVHNFSESDIAESRQDALMLGYEPYDSITTSTSYLFMLRETGGIATGAYVDGRNPYYSANKYYDSNVGLESYLIELGYMNVSKDLYNILNNADSYMEAIAESVEAFYLQ